MCRTRRQNVFTSMSFALAALADDDGERNNSPASTATASPILPEGMIHAKKQNPSGNVAAKKSVVWEHAWVPNGARREKVKALIKEMQREYLRSDRTALREWSDVRAFFEDGMEILVQWAQLGEGTDCEALANEMHNRCASWTTNKVEYHDLQIKIRRRVLHAYYNQLQRTTWNAVSKKPRFQLSQNEAMLGCEVLKKADETLRIMEHHSLEFVNKHRTHNKIMRPLLDANDFTPLILGYNQVGRNAVAALRALRRLTELFEQSEYLERLAPSTSLYLAVSKAIFNHKESQDWIDRVGKSQAEVIDILCKECVNYSHRFPRYLRPSINLFNVALDAWSKALPPPSRNRDISSSTTHFVDDEDRSKILMVENAVNELWTMLLENNLVPNSKTLTSLIYAFVKTGNIDQAFVLAEQLFSILLKNPLTEVKVDCRALRMLATSLARTITAPMDESIHVASAERVENLLKSLWDLDKAGYSDVAPDVFLYTTATDAWANTRSQQSYQRAQSLVDDLNTRYVSSGLKESLKPDIGVYNALLKAIALQPGLVGAAEKAGVIVKKLENELSIRPNIITYNALIEACIASPLDIYKAEQTLDHLISSGRPSPNERTFSIIIHALLSLDGNTSRAEAILDRMEHLFIPRASLYEEVISSWCREAGMANRARQLLSRMEAIFARQGDDESLRPNRSLYNKVIQASEDQLETAQAAVVKTKRDEMYGSALINRRIRSNNQVFATLRDVTENLSGVGVTSSGNTANFNRVIAQLADSGKIWAGLRAEDVLNYMLEHTFKRNNRDATPDIVTFNTVISAWAKSEHALAAEKAAEVMKKLDEFHKMGLLEDVVADRVTYNTLMNAYAKSSDRSDSGQKAQECFEKLRALYEETSDEKYKPDLISYSTLLSAWARSGDSGAAKIAEGILLRMHADYTEDNTNPRPNTACFNQVLYAWARSRDVNSADRAEMVLRLMEDMKNSGNVEVVPTTCTYNIVLLALANSKDPDSPMRAMKLLRDMKRTSESKPDTVSYNTAISALTKKGLVNSALQMLEELFVQNDVDLDSKFFSSLIYSLSQTEASDAPIVAERIVSDLLERQHIEVTTDICNALIHCWGRSSSFDQYRRALRANEILTEMLQGKFSLSAPPDVVTFTSVIDIWAKSGDPEAADRAETVLHKMKGIAKPNVKTYTATIQAFARSQDRDKAKRAQELLQRMKEDFLSGNRDAEPNVYVYNAVLNAAEFTVGNEAELEVAFQVACETFDEVRSSESIQPDHVTYGSFMGVISQLMPKSDIRNDMIQLVFRRCCADGQLAPVVIKKFKEAADSAQVVALMGKRSVNDSSLPKEWSCNVRGARQ